MPLTELAIKQLKPSEKPKKVSDGGGLYLHITTAGSKLWRVAYRFESKQKVLSIGSFPNVSLKDARRARESAKALLDQGIDPGEERKKRKEVVVCEEVATFEKVARQWIAKMTPSWSASRAIDITKSLEKNVFPWLGQSDIKKISASDILRVLEGIEQRGVVYTAHRARQIIGQIYRFAMACGFTEADPSVAMRGALTPFREKHRASIVDPEKIAILLRVIDGYQGSFVTKCALRLAPLLFVRPGELRHAEWSEINLHAAEWRIPAGKMKMRDPHFVPLARQAVMILNELRQITGNCKYVFPGARSLLRPMSENTVLAALRRLGYEKNEMTGHGFRSMASTRLNEMGWPPDVIERQLAHVERNAVRAAYNRAEYLPERRKMMQAWADYLDSLKGGDSIAD
ncbi:MAG: tyrosine-type recombinase/integrase, partial [Magnetococcales bacterium]|nr:tyrosine-type recombinase/integrase [Magnetococcales bacterium]